MCIFDEVHVHVVGDTRCYNCTCHVTPLDDPVTDYHGQKCEICSQFRRFVRTCCKLTIDVRFRHLGVVSVDVAFDGRDHFVGVVAVKARMADTGRHEIAEIEVGHASGEHAGEACEACRGHEGGRLLLLLVLLLLLAGHDWYSLWGRQKSNDGSGSIKQSKARAGAII